jgi:short-subunit dehydrogenase
MKIAIISATSQIAINAVKVWCHTQNHEVILVGRDSTKLHSVSSDLAIRYPNSKFTTRTFDLLDPVEIQKWIDSPDTTNLDLALIAQGSLTDQTRVSNDLPYLSGEINLNVGSVALFLEGLATKFKSANKGHIAVIGSVAGDRGRASNYSYGSAKAFVETYTQGLQQALSKTSVAVTLIKPGPTATPMTQGMTGRFSNPEDIAKIIVKGLAKRKRVIYAPKIWNLIMFIVKRIPFALFKNLKF